MHCQMYSAGSEWAAAENSLSACWTDSCGRSCVRGIQPVALSDGILAGKPSGAEPVCVLADVVTHNPLGGLVPFFVVACLVHLNV